MYTSNNLYSGSHVHIRVYPYSGNDVQLHKTVEFLKKMFGKFILKFSVSVFFKVLMFVFMPLPRHRFRTI